MAHRIVVSWILYACVFVGILYGGYTFYQIDQQYRERLWLIRLNAATLDTTGTGRIIVDNEGIIRYFGLNAEHITGFRKREVIGKASEIIIPVPHRESHKSAFSKAAERYKHRITYADCEVLRKDGTTVPVHLTVMPARMDDELYFLVLINSESTVVNTSMKGGTEPLN